MKKFTGKITTWILLFLVLMGCQTPSASPANPIGIARPLPKDSSYEVVVVGSEPEGIAAALASARQGKKTLLLTADEALGGLWTLGRLNFLDMNYGPDQRLLTQGIFLEFYEALGDAFDIEEAIAYFHQITEEEELLEVHFNTGLIRPVLEEAVLVGLELEEGQRVHGKRFIDATVNADLAAAAGVPFTFGGEDYGQGDKWMAATLVFNVDQVNWFKVYTYNNLQRLTSMVFPGKGDPHAGARRDLAWGYGSLAEAYQPQDPLLRLRGPNLARQANGEILLNALLIFGVDPIDSLSVAAGRERALAELPHILAFMQETFAGFEKARLVDGAPKLYIRESRHVLGEYRLTIDDVLENHDHWDRIAHGSYPVDIQSRSPGDTGNVIGKPEIYSIPFRCLVPLKIENLLVVGQAASYDSLAHGSARVVPVGIVAAEAAGTAASLSIDLGINFRQLSRTQKEIVLLQERLIEQGAYLQAFESPRPKVMDHWAYEGLRQMRALGLASGGYINEYGLDQPAEENLLRWIFQATQHRILQLRPESDFGSWEGLDRIDSREKLLEAYGALMKLDQESWENWPGWSREIRGYFEPLEEKPTRGQVYWLAKSMYDEFLDNEEAS